MSGLPGFVAAWGRALRAVAYAPLTPPERTTLLAGLAERLAGALAAPAFDPAAGYWVGTDLVAAGYAAPEALGRTLTVLRTRLPGALGGEVPQERVTALVESLAAGFAAAVHERSLDAQESIRLAALTARDRAERKLRESEARIRHLVTHDPLTGLPNRAALAGLLAAAGDRVGLCCIDLDRFAGVNDSLGPGVGDRLLGAAADRLRALVAAGGHRLLRLDGDQFAILLADTAGSEDAIKMADRALAVLAEPFHVDGTEVPLTASAGVVERPAGGEPAELIRAAHIALHWAKADGRGCWRLFDDARSTADAARYRLSAAIPAGLRRGEFTLDYQPLVALTGGAARVTGAEALARWRHPVEGRLGADRFIGLAQDAGLIVPLGDHLLELACQQAAGWRTPDGTDPPHVNVNLAAPQVYRAGLAGLVAQILDRTGLPPHRLHLEITEYALIEPTREVLANLRALGALGVRVVVDDFGTGYSNLACLRTLPLHGIKLAAALVGPPAAAASDRAFLATVVALGHTLGLTVTAEGIETAEQAERMREAGCDVGQGYYFGRPLSSDRIARRIAAPLPRRSWTDDAGSTAESAL
ncbi:putative bifunctional diguanylate cyclase/phosphodiesterase [Rhizomonospora bruguierae]|uniref:putative bifunctional diguanylate cyclase/phosphodiesterase n=1 Tax=Rhizomonospora bruguierae TaxID=1581705 RepID=UPI0020BE0BFC|nr:bifunctional diguanylate cyclase/phosphodiesterase [Micromonospora sp. NBRC 107566]